MRVIYTAVYRPCMVHPKIEDVDKRAVQLRNQLAVLVVDRRQTLGELVQEAFPDQKVNGHALIEGHWPCPDDDGEGRQGTPHSPTGKCIYVVGNNDDHCIFCGLPTERQ